MSERVGSVSRTTAFVAVLAAFFLLGLPSFNMGGGDRFGAVGPAEAAGIDVPRNFILGVAELTADSLNPNTATMVSEYLLIYYCYSYLVGYDVNMNIIGDLATKWSVTPDGLLWNFKLVDNAYFCDPASPTTKNHPVTAADVIFTFWSLQNNTKSRLYSYFPDVIESMWSVGPYDLYIKLKRIHAPIMESFLAVPILPKYYWAGKDFIKFDNLPPIGSGPVYYATMGLPTTGSAELKRNPIWFQTENKGWQLHTDSWIIKEEMSPDGALINLDTGALDCYLRLPPPQYKITLPTKANVIGFSFSGGFVYEYNLNQMTNEMRWALKGSFLKGSNNQLLLDPTVKRAMAMAVDKYAFVDDPLILWGLGSYADSLVPPANPGHYWIPDPIEFDLAAARQLLWDAGWRYDATGAPATSTTCPLAKAGGTDVLSFRFYTLDTGVTWENAAMRLRDWAKEIGVELRLEIKSVSAMNSIWYAADYDVWLWDWVMGVTSDPAGILEVFTTMSIGSSSDVYWSNATYDALYNLSMITVDPVVRQEIFNEMQRMAYWNLGCQCVAYSNDNYAVSTVNWAKESLGDWNKTYMLLPDISAQWPSMQMYPNNNHAPYFTSYTGRDSVVTAEVGVPESFLATGLDDDPTTPLAYRWFWGDGTKTDWSSSGAASHTYTSDGVYEVWVAVREAGVSNGFDDNFTTSAMATVEVYDMSNRAPTGVSFTYDPLNPDSGTYVSFVGTATDPDGDPLYYTWDFGDGHSEDGQTTEHQFGAEGSFTVTLSVTDKHLGQGSRPVTYSQLIYVARNNEPTLSVPDFPDIPTKQTRTYTVSASDPEDPLRFTWFWGDGTRSVTTVPSATHSYQIRGTYVLTVYADDLTGLPGHNVSDTGNVYVYNQGGNKAPTSVSLSVDDSTPFTGQPVTFTARATDPDGDAMTFTLAFGDGTYYVESFGPSDQEVTLVVEKAYGSVGSYSARVYASDGLANTSSSAVGITVSLNYAPEFGTELPDIYESAGVQVTVVADVYDLDGDPLTFTWIWGDGSVDVTTVETASHTYTAPYDGVYRLWVNDGFGHNVSDAAFVEINSIPQLEPLSDLTLVVGEPHVFTAEVTDENLLSYMWDFGDGSDYAFDEAPLHTYAAAGTYYYTVWVDDGFLLPTHNVSSTARVTVLDAPDTEPPVADAGPDQTVMAGELVTFDGSGSTDNVGIVSWVWTFTWGGNPVVLSGETATFVFDDTNIDVTVTLTVTDGSGNSDTDEMVVHVGEWIPEFTTVLLPAAATITLLLGMMAIRRRRT